MRSAGFDTVLGLAEKDNKVIAYNDDFENPTTDSQVKISLNAGEYSVLASTYDSMGAYTLSFEREPLRSCDMPELGTGPATGTLTAEDCRLLDILTPDSDTAPADAFRLRVSTKGVYSFHLASAAFLPDVRIYDKNSALLYTASGKPASPDARFEILLAPGEYRIVASTRDGLGEYTLTTTRQDPKVCETSGRLESTIESMARSRTRIARFLRRYRMHDQLIATLASAPIRWR